MSFPRRVGWNNRKAIPFPFYRSGSKSTLPIPPVAKMYEMENNPFFPRGFDVQKFLIGNPVRYNSERSQQRNRFNFRSA